MSSNDLQDCVAYTGE